jgi:hypothetical protein
MKQHILIQQVKTSKLKDLDFNNISLEFCTKRK